MEITGLINEVPVEALIRQAEAEEQTGTLFLKSDFGIGEICFENGLIYGSDAPCARERLGYKLLEDGEIHAFDLYQVLRDQEDYENAPLGEILLKKELLPQETVQHVFIRQTEEAVLRLLTWEEGQFSFERNTPKNSHQIHIKPELLLKDKKKRMRELKPSASKGVMERVQEHPDPLIHRRLYKKIERTVSKTEVFEPDIVILLVEGDPKWRMMVQEEMAKQNFHVKGVSTTEKAQSEVERALAKGSSPIVITDIDFPRQQENVKLAGLAFMEDLHKKHPKIPVLVCTSYPISNLRRKILFLGGIFCLVKPDLSILSSRSFEQIFQAFVQELVYCLDHSIHQYYRDYFQQREEMIRNDLIEDLYNTGLEQIHLENQVIQDAKVQETFHRVSNMLVREGNVDGAIEAVLEEMTQRYDHVALFLWGKKYLNGYLGKSSHRADFSDKVREISVDYEKIPFLAKLYKEKEIFSGPPPGEAAYTKFLKRFRKGTPRRHLLYPVEVMGKVVALWYADTEKQMESGPSTRNLIALINLVSLSLKMDIENT